MSVFLVPNKTKPTSIEAAERLCAFLADHGIAVVMSEIDRFALPATFDIVSLPEGEAVPESVELIVALGGDGTILKAAHLTGGADVPLLGVKLGLLGFLAGCDVDDMCDAVLAALANEVRLESRATVVADVEYQGGTLAGVFALNEIVVARGASGRVIGFDVSIAGSRLAHMRGDGVLVATATGSTGYALSAGGPVVAPGFGGLVLVPIAPHTLNARAVLTDPDDEIVIDLTADVRGEAGLFVDGEPLDVPGRLLRVTLRRGDSDIVLAHYDERAFYSSVSSVFFGGE